MEEWKKCISSIRARGDISEIQPRMVFALSARGFIPALLDEFLVALG